MSRWPPMPRRDRHLLLTLAFLAAGLAALTLIGVHSDVLLALPVLLVAVPLVAGRYVGEERLARLAAAFVASRRRRPASSRSTARRSPRALPRGGRLIASSLAVRPPPAAMRHVA